ncbi:hypothetical protein BH09PSE5_BH09PSE5_18250 [soil metagenome]
MGQNVPPGFALIKPTPTKAAPPASAPELRIGQGRFFNYAMPAGWRVGEDGQFALTLVAPDNKAHTVMVGNAGLMPNYPPGQFVYDKLMAMRPQRLQLDNPRPARPVAGFQVAYSFAVAMVLNGVPYRGVAVCHVQNYYGGAVMAMTSAIAEASQWPSYEPWLGNVAAQISANNGAAFGARGVMQQNLRNSTEYAEAARQYRDWSQKNWQQVTDQRNASVDRRAFATRENLGGIQTYTNPRDGGKTVELTNQYKHFWVDRQGNMAGTNDPSVDPNVGGTGDWVRMPRYQP